MRDARCEIAELWRQWDGRQRVWFVVLFPPLIPLAFVLEVFIDLGEVAKDIKGFVARRTKRLFAIKK